MFTKKENLITLLDTKMFLNGLAPFQCGTPLLLVKIFEFIKINNTLRVER